MQEMLIDDTHFKAIESYDPILSLCFILALLILIYAFYKDRGNNNG
jgi:hypothetical protein